MASFGEEDIRPAKMMEDKQRCIEADRAFLLSRKASWVDVDCPACDCRPAVCFGEKRGFRYDECPKCGTVYTNPRPSQALLNDFYASSENYAYWNQYVFPSTEATRREKICLPRVRRIVELCRSLDMGGTLLEIGAGFGTFCEEIKRTGVFDEVMGLEPTPTLAASCRSKGLQVIETPVERLNDKQVADLLVAFEVIEHLFDPGDFVGRCAQLLRPRGLLVLTCPNVRGFDLMMLRTLSNTFDHEHLNYFTVSSLPALLETKGLEILDVQTPGQLDAELVRKQVLTGAFSLEGQPLLAEILLRRWDELGSSFQSFLSTHRLSSHLWVIARKS
jgi:2-polyprenyl-3-methyl-5-hydroxy-6-metoxy-1,4-benzoquinol methylase